MTRLSDENDAGNFENNILNEKAYNDSRSWFIDYHNNMIYYFPQDQNTWATGRGRMMALGGLRGTPGHQVH